MTDMLRTFDQICHMNDLRYWCVGGTLIGAVRHQGWVPHDADEDVAMLTGDYARLQVGHRKGCVHHHLFFAGGCFLRTHASHV